MTASGFDGDPFRTHKEQIGMMYSVNGTVPALGLAWSHCINTRIMLSKQQHFFSEHLSLPSQAMTTTTLSAIENSTAAYDPENAAAVATAVAVEAAIQKTRRRMTVLFSPLCGYASIAFVVTHEGVFGHALE